MEMKQCPKCGKPMNFQANKTNEKAPDWKCSDSACKWKKVKGQWVASDFITGEWNEQSTSQPQEPQYVSPAMEKVAEKEAPAMEMGKPKNEVQENIRWCNALNNACLLIAHGYKFGMESGEKNINELANWIYKLEPKNGDMPTGEEDYN